MGTIYVGAYTQPEDHVLGHGEGIYCYHMDEASGALSLQGVARGIANPSFLAVDDRARFLYAVSEVITPEGGVHAFAIDGKTHLLAHINRQPSLGAAPCHVSLSKNFLLVANYMGGSVAVLPIRADGSLGSATDHMAHHGSSVNEQRQQAPHPHSIKLDKAQRFALAPDLGTDSVVVYRFDAAKGRLEPTTKTIRVQPGAGPRHIAFDQTGRYAYLMNELDSTLTVFSYADGSLSALQTAPALPESFGGAPSGADVHAHPQGAFVYASLRGTGSIVRFSVHPRTGLLTRETFTSTQGETPRNFAIDPAGRFLIAANQDSDSLVVFRINAETGRLTPTGRVTHVPSPACVLVVG